jgi:lysophospholipase L1-like esterase
MIKLLKLSAVNILVFLGILIFLNLMAISMYQLSHFRIFPHTHTSDKWRLPNYKNIEWARNHFKEFGELQGEYRSYIGWRRLPYKGQTINIDKQGIRVTPQSELATATSPLVVFLGGSALWGTGVDDANTIPALFAKIAKGRYRVMNLGESAYNAFQGYLFLKLQIINGLRPDIVVSYDGVNDAHCLKPGLRPFSHQREDQIRTAMKGKDRKNEEELSFSHFFLNPLKIYISMFNNAKNPTYDLSQERIEQTAKALLEGWLSTKDLAEKNGAHFIAVLQPNAAIGKPYLKHLNLDKDEDLLKLYKLFYPAVIKLLQTPKYQELSNNVIVLTDAFDLEEYIYIDDCHVSPNGNKIIATKIYNYINNSIDNKKNG